CACPRGLPSASTVGAADAFAGDSATNRVLGGGRRARSKRRAGGAASSSSHVLACAGSVRLRRKITVAFFLVSSLVSLLLPLFRYRFRERRPGGEVRGRLMDMARIGAAEVEIEPYQQLMAQLGEVDDAKVAAIEHSPQYKEIYSHLRMIRAAEPALIHYAYLI